ncbi:hypothetical protein [Sphaerisporangium sp. NPDC051011]|uniref:hypothetical protein n=1 Tax=Sphaerisporangium sp. NPDC051011 TaxID=3155792 RepID=UPI0033C6A25B
MGLNTAVDQARAEALTYVEYLDDDRQAAWRAAQADAEVMARRVANRHHCARRQPQDPPCAHPQHDDDIAFSRLARVALGLIPETESTAQPVRPTRDTCHECGRRVKLLATGLLRGAMTTHSRNHPSLPYERCKGSKHVPRKATT